MFFLEIEKMHGFLFFFFSIVGFNQWTGGGGVRLGWDPAHEFPVRQQSAACYRRSFPFRWIFKIFPSLCLAVAMPFFSRFAAKRQEKTGGEKTSSKGVSAPAALITYIWLFFSLSVVKILTCTWIQIIHMKSCLHICLLGVFIPAFE